jgi:hypothetical protein
LAAEANAWTSAVDYELGQLHAEGVSIEILREFMAKIQIDSSLADAIRSYSRVSGGEV